jgi:hypothetical protein
MERKNCKTEKDVATLPQVKLCTKREEIKTEQQEIQEDCNKIRGLFGDMYHATKNDRADLVAIAAASLAGYFIRIAVGPPDQNAELEKIIEVLRLSATVDHEEAQRIGVIKIWYEHLVQ